VELAVFECDPRLVDIAMATASQSFYKALWDPLVDESWVATQIQLIPRLRSWVNTYYVPGTPIGITEYNWGAESHNQRRNRPGRYSWHFRAGGRGSGRVLDTPDPSTPTFKAIQMYRNYDGARSVFGNTSVSATVPNPDNVSAFAALRSGDGALTVMVIANTSLAPRPLHLNSPISPQERPLTCGN